MSQRETLESLQDILDEIEAIEEFVSEIDNFRDFQEDRKTIYAVTRAIEVIGEAVKSVARDTRNIRSQYPDVPWKAIAGMRDKSIHDYWSLDKEVLWRTATESIPELKVQIQTVKRDLENSDNATQG